MTTAQYARPIATVAPCRATRYPNVVKRRCSSVVCFGSLRPKKLIAAVLLESRGGVRPTRIRLPPGYAEAPKWTSALHALILTLAIRPGREVNRRGRAPAPETTAPGSGAGPPRAMPSWGVSQRAGAASLSECAVISSNRSPLGDGKRTGLGQCSRPGDGALTGAIAASASYDGGRSARPAAGAGRRPSQVVQELLLLAEAALSRGGVHCQFLR